MGKALNQDIFNRLVIGTVTLDFIIIIIGQ